MAQLFELHVDHLRSVDGAKLELAPRSNLIFGANGAGKTSLLEAAFLLGRGRSFRQRSTERLIQHGAAACRVFGRVQQGPLVHALGVEVSAAGTRARIDGTTPGGLAALAREFPVQVLDPELHRLIEDGPSVRRRWLDWAVFHVEHAFGDAWSRYRRALLQRNELLAGAGRRAGAGRADAVQSEDVPRYGAASDAQQADDRSQPPNSLGHWDQILAAEGERLTSFRRSVVAALEPIWERYCEELVGVPISLGFQSGWEKGVPLADALARALQSDRERGITSVGPHRAEIALRVNGRSARDVLSRGQQKLAGASLVLCQLEYLRVTQSLLPTLLLDDPSAELDSHRLQAFIERVGAVKAQLILTALTKDFSLFGRPEAVFHVERGGVEKVY